MKNLLIKEIFQILPYIKNTGATNLWFDYDKKADVLYVSFRRPQRATDTDILENGVFVHTRGEEFVGMTIINFSKNVQNIDRK